MSFRRISSTALTLACRDMRAARPALVRDGRFNVRAIMQQAVRFARAQFRADGSWSNRMKLALVQVWRRAKAEMAQAVAVTARPVPVPVQRRPAPAGVSGFTRGSRAFSHGW